MNDERKRAQGELHEPITEISAKLDGLVQDMNFSRSVLKSKHRFLLDDAEQAIRRARDNVYTVGNELEPWG